MNEDNNTRLDSLYYCLSSKNSNKQSMKNGHSYKYLITKEIFEYSTDKKISFTLIRSKRRKTSEIIVDKNEIVLRVPFDKPPWGTGSI